MGPCPQVCRALRGSGFRCTHNCSTKLTPLNDGDRSFDRTVHVEWIAQLGRCSMAALAGNPTSVWGPFDWTLLFARQPEPDLEFTEEELDQTVATKARAPLNPHKKPSGGKPILWVLILILVGGIAYVSMEPEMMTELLSPYLGESTPPPPMTTMRPKPAVPAPAPPPIAPSVPAPQPAPSPSAQAPTPSAPVAPSPTDAAPAAPPVAPPTTARPAARSSCFVLWES